MWSMTARFRATVGVRIHKGLRQRACWCDCLQPASLDLSEISFAVNEERKVLLENFDAWAIALRERLAPYWADAACPVQGNAHFGTSTSVIYNELEGLTQLLK